MEIAVITSSIAAVAAIVAPTIAEIVRGRREVKLRRMELLYPSKAEAYLGFAEAFSKYRHKLISRDAFRSAIDKCYLLCDEDSRKILSGLSAATYDALTADEMYLDYIRCMEKLSADLTATRN